MMLNPKIQDESHYETYFDSLHVHGRDGSVAAYNLALLKLKLSRRIVQ